jgi:hypothetical protein
MVQEILYHSVRYSLDKNILICYYFQLKKNNLISTKSKLITGCERVRKKSSKATKDYLQLIGGVLKKLSLQDTGATFSPGLFDKKFHAFTKIRQLLLYFVSEGDNLMLYILKIELLNSKKASESYNVYLWSLSSQLCLLLRLNENFARSL